MYQSRECIFLPGGVESGSDGKKEWGDSEERICISMFDKKWVGELVAE